MNPFILAIIVALSMSTNYSFAEEGSSIVNPYQVYTYEQMIEDAKKLQELYPNIIKLDTIGKSLEERELLLIVLGNGEKKITLNGSHHAREYITTTFLMKMIEEYAHHYSNNTDCENYNVKKLLDNVSIYIVPMVNPDGVSLVQKGECASKNPELVKKINEGNNFTSWKANGRGVDLNNQYPYGWENINNGKTGPSTAGFKGYSSLSEPETRALSDFSYSNPFLIYAAYHTQGEEIWWYKGQTGYFYNQAVEISNRLSDLTGYKLVSKKRSAVNFWGGYADWTFSEFKKPSFTLELCPYVGPYPYPDEKFDMVWNRVKLTGLFFANEALNMQGYDYKVYQFNKLLQVFNNEEDAVQFASKWNDSSVVKDNIKIWNN